MESKIPYKKDLIIKTDGIIIDKRMGVYIFAEHYRGEIVRITNISYCPKCGKKLI